MLSNETDKENSRFDENMDKMDVESFEAPAALEYTYCKS